MCYSHLLRCSTACGVLVACVKRHGPYNHCAARRLDGYRKGVSTPHQQAPTLRRAETIAVPSHASTLTACSVTFLATPKVLPADGRTRSVCIAARGCCSTDIAQHMGMACKACTLPPWLPRCSQGAACMPRRMQLSLCYSPPTTAATCVPCPWQSSLLFVP